MPNPWAWGGDEWETSIGWNGVMDNLICDTSLGQTLAAADDYLTSGCQWNPRVTSELVDWVIGRQIRSGSHRGMFELLDLDTPSEARTVLGERLYTRLGIRNTVSQEASRVLWIIGSERADVRDTIQLATDRMSRTCYALHHCVIGECAHASIGHLRFLASVRKEASAPWIQRHLSVIRSLRDGSGRWNKVPFYYTLRCLVELEHEAANAELRYSVQACLRVARRIQPDERYGQRQARLIESVLNRYSTASNPALNLFDESDGSNG